MSKFFPGTVEENSSTIGPPASTIGLSHRRRFDSCRRTYIIVDEFFSTVPGSNFDTCIISTRY